MKEKWRETRRRQDAHARETCNFRTSRVAASSLLLFLSLLFLACRERDIFQFPGDAYEAWGFTRIRGCQRGKSICDLELGPSECKQRERKRQKERMARRMRERKGIALYSCWEKKRKILLRIRENGGTGRYTQIRARSYWEEAGTQKRRMRYFPRISRINEKCQIFRHTTGVRQIPRLIFRLYFRRCRLECVRTEEK